jgi:hypothetical protein
MSKPDLIFYYELLNPTTVINKIPLGSDTIQTANGDIFADPELKFKIGSFAFNITALGVNIPQPDKLYQAIGTNVYFLPEGSISNSINLQFIKDNNGNLVIPPNSLNVYQILSGSRDFLNQRGIIVQETNDISQLRKMMVYFDK